MVSSGIALSCSVSSLEFGATVPAPDTELVCNRMVTEKRTSDDHTAAGRPYEEAAFQAEVYCPECTYNLRGVVGERCPECGYSLANMRSPICRIPWVRRRECGRFLGYWRTIWMVTFRNQRFCEEYARPVSFADARMFLWVTLVHLYIPVLLAVAFVYLSVPAKSEVANPLQQMMTTGMVQSWPTFVYRAYAEVWPVATLLPCLLLFLASATSLPSYFFHPRAVSAQQQDNGIAMSCYACGPLAFLGVLFVAMLLATDALAIFSRTGHAALLAAIISTCVVLLAWWLNLVGIARRSMPRLKSRQVLIAIGVPLLWGALAGLILVGLPFVILSVLVIWASLG